MLGKVVCGIDFSEHSNLILDFVRDYSNFIEEALLVRVVNLTRFYGIIFNGVEKFVEEEREKSEEKLKYLASELDGVKARFAVPVGNPAEEIVKIAKEEKADMIAVGTRGRSKIKRILLGSVAEGVVRLSDIPVLVVKNRRMFDRILYVHYPLNFDENLLSFLNTLGHMSYEMEILHVIEPMLPPESTQKRLMRKYAVAEEVLNEVARNLDVRVKTSVKFGYPTRIILEESKKHSLVVLRVPEKITGTTDAILRHSKASVLVIRR